MTQDDNIPSTPKPSAEISFELEAKRLITEIETFLADNELEPELYNEVASILNLLSDINITENIHLLYTAKHAVILIKANFFKQSVISVSEKANNENDVKKLKIKCLKRLSQKIKYDLFLHKVPWISVFLGFGSNSAHLISGLTWFLIVFFVIPVTFLAIHYDFYNKGYQQGYKAAKNELLNQPTPQPQLELSDLNRTDVNINELSQETKIQDLIETQTYPDADQGIYKDIQEIRGIRFFLIPMVFGALGSAISVIVKIQNIDRQSRTDSITYFLTGFFKPLVGMGFSFFILASIESGIIPIEKPVEQKEFFYIAVAFAAGFSERLVQDVLSNTEKRIIK
ncbi:hypothetical protein [Coleofasciculus sp.]|uniref:hypothetical protein n=1 Tax=Coleofasciculus sp. TaxID=3100458 RepID=UPI0039FB7C1F